MIVSRWRIADRPPTRPGCFIVPSYAVRDATRPTRPTIAQIDLAIVWWQKFPDAKIIMCTGDNQNLGVTNARIMVEYAMRQGVPRENLIEEARSINTWQNLAYAREIFEREQLEQPTIVALDLYTRRAVATARKIGWRDFHWLSVVAAGEPAYGWKAIQTYSRLTIFCYEFGAYMFSKIIGWA